MPAPLKKGYNFHVEYVEKGINYAMRSTDIYTEFYGIGLIVSGDRKIETPNRTYFAHPGNVTPMNMGIYHRTSSISNEPFIRYGLKFTAKLATSCIEQIGEDNFNHLMSHFCYTIPPKTIEHITHIFDDILYEYEHYDEHSEYIVAGMLSHLLITLLREGEVANSTEMYLNISDSVILNVLSFIDLHYDENPSIETLAKLTNLSCSHFMKRFRDCIGSSYKTYMNCYKVRLAQNLLTNTDLSIIEISNQLGFCNSNYFTNIFTKISGSCPRDYRKVNNRTI